MRVQGKKASSGQQQFQRRFVFLQEKSSGKSEAAAVPWITADMINEGCCSPSNLKDRRFAGRETAAF